MKEHKLMLNILLSVGGGSIINAFASLFIDEIAKAEYFQSMIFGLVFVGILSWLFFEKKIISPDIWVRRFFSIVCDYFILLASMLLFGVLSPTPMQLLISISLGLGCSFMVGIPLWYLADRCEKKQLEKINAKLEKNE